MPAANQEALASKSTTESRTDEQLRIRAALRLEIQRNLDALHEFWLNVTRIPSPEGNYEEMEFEKRLRLFRLLLEEPRQLVWKSQAGVLPIVLTPNEYEHCYALYDDLEKFTVRCNAVKDALNTPTAQQLIAAFEQWRQQVGSNYQGYLPTLSGRLQTFNNQTLAPFDACAAIYQTTRQMGNPIPADAPTHE